MDLRQVFILACIFCHQHDVTSYDLPNLGEVFGNLMKAQSEDSTEESGDASHSRSKRQNPEIGDESQYHYEARSSA